MTHSGEITHVKTFQVSSKFWVTRSHQVNSKLFWIKYNFLGLDDFPAGEPVHIIAPIGATFLKQRAVHLRVGPTRLRGASSGVVPPPSSSTGTNTTKVSGVVGANVPLPTTSNDSDIWRMLDHVLTIQAAHGQILVDVLDEIRGLCIELAQFHRSSPPTPFDDGFWLPFDIPSQKGGVHIWEYIFDYF